MPRLRLTPVQALAIIGLALALAVRLWGIGFGAHVPLARPDEELFLMSGYSYFGTPSAADTLGVTGWPMGFVRIVHFVEVLERLVLRAPNGQPANLGCIYALRPAAVLVGIRLVSVLCDVLTCLVVGLTARRLARREHAQLALGFGILAYAVNYLAAREAHNGMMNSALGLGLALTTLACVRAIQDSPWWLVAAGALAGASFGIKYSASPLLLTCLAAGIACLLLQPHPQRTLGIGALTLAASVAGLCASSPEIFTNLEPFWRGLMSAVGRYQPSFNGMLDLSWHPIPGWRFHLFTDLPTAFGWVGYLLAIAGLALALWDRGWEAGPVAATAVGAALMLAPVTQLFVRYAVPILPSLAVGLALALTRLSVFAHERLPGLQASLGFSAIAVLALGPPLVRLCQYDHILAQPDTRDLAQQWLLDHGGTGATLGYYQRVHFVEPSWVEACRGRVPSWVDGPVALTPDHGPPFWSDLVQKDPESLVQETLDAAFKGNDLSGADYVFWPLPLVMCGKQGRLEAPDPGGQCFELVDTLSPGTPACGDLFDMFDSFFVPYTAFAGVVRPGPEIKIYKNLCKR
jgi:hypothetical protein